MRPAATVTRRTVLGAGLLLIAGCKHTRASHSATLPPDESALNALLADEASVLAATTDPTQFAMHVQHYVALGGSTTGYAAPPMQPVGAYRRLLGSSTTSLRQAAIDAVDGTHAATFASIAASHEVMLRG
ncbi:MAG TPA: hypothetical protein VHW74_14520 [Mycobacteriales bacterium]|jgi:hypothetical protein|nr:hypothetical protein [Mycobacteriales bacterium]